MTRHHRMHVGTLNVIVRGDWLPRHLLGKGHVVCAIIRSLFLALCMIFDDILYRRCNFDIFVVDQLSAPIPLLRTALGTGVVFYCHFPDKLLTGRETLVKRLYRYVLFACALSYICKDTQSISSKSGLQVCKLIL